MDRPGACKVTRGQIDDAQIVEGVCLMGAVGKLGVDVAGIAVIRGRLRVVTGQDMHDAQVPQGVRLAVAVAEVTIDGQGLTLGLDRGVEVAGLPTHHAEVGERIGLPQPIAGLVLFPGDGDTSSPDVPWSYSGFAAFRRRLAQAEGFALSEMWGFGGERPWSEVSTVLESLLDHPDDGDDDLSPTECAVILPRLETITDRWANDGDDILLHEHIEKNVPLCFL